MIPNTLEVADIWVSAPLIEEARGIEGLEVVGSAQELPFDGIGGLKQQELFPECVRALRGSAKGGH